MSTYERLRTLRYISPRGTEFELQFDDLQRSGGRKTPVSEYPGQDAGGAQDMGSETRSYPVSCYLSGPDYDEAADRFADALDEPGPGRLIHPRWGDHSVLPTSWQQSERFLNGAGQAVFSIEFVEANPEQLRHLTDRIAAFDKLRGLFATALQSTADAIGVKNVPDPAALIALRENAINGLDAVRDGFATITGVADDTRGAIEATVADIQRNIDTLAQNPADLVRELTELYRLPGDTITNVSEKIAGYRAIFDNLAQSFTGPTSRYAAIAARNTASERTRRLLNADELSSAETLGLLAVGQVYGLQAAVCEAATAGLDGNTAGTRVVRTRAEAIAAVDQLTALAKDVTGVAEQMGVAMYDIARDGAAIVAVAVGALVDGALALPTERTIVLEGDTTPIHLAVELFGGLDRLDECIEYNELSGDELLLVPRGREVRYYV